MCDSNRLDVANRQYQQIGRAGRGLTDEFGKRAVVANCASHAPVRSCGNGQMAIAAPHDARLPAWYWVVLQVRDQRLSGRIDQHELVFERTRLAEVNRAH